MAVIINYKICDQANACGGISVCPVGAFTYNEKTKRIEIDNSKCISCGACEKVCPIGAIGVAKTKEEYDELKQAIEDDPRSPEDLFVDRYGGDVINKNVMIDFSDIGNLIKQENCLIEVIDEDSIKCLLKSIRYSDIIEHCDVNKYFRCILGAGDDVSVFGITEFPSLIVCKNSKIDKIISGYFEESEKQKLFNYLK